MDPKVYAISIVGALILGWLKGGRVGRLGQVPLRLIILLPVPFIIRSILLRSQYVDGTLLSRMAEEMQVLAYSLLVVLAVANRHLPGSPLLIGGTLANALVIVANGGRMPVSEWAIRIAAGGADRIRTLDYLRSGVSLTHEILVPGTRFPWLADIIPVPRPFPFPSVASLGDVALAIGLAWLVYSAMVGRIGNGSKAVLSGPAGGAIGRP
ncbi:DUF5317 domain-containing protein [Thermaerobacter litoralis]